MDEDEFDLLNGSTLGAGFFSVHAIATLVVMSGVDREQYLGMLKTLAPDERSSFGMRTTYAKLYEQLSDLVLSCP